MIGDVARYLVTAIVIALCGAGVSSCLSIRLDPALRLLIGPAFGQAWAAIALGTGVAFGLPVHVFAYWFWILTGVLAIAGLLRLRSDFAATNQKSRAVGWTVTWCAWLAPIVTMGPYFVHGLADYAGSGLPDGWAYVAYGQYLWDFPRGTEGGLTPLYQYAATLSNTRNVAGAELGVLAMLRSAGDVQAGFGLLQAVALFVYATAVAAAAMRLASSRLVAVASIIVTVLSGWILNVLWANNLDNLAALAYAPALACLAAYPEPDRAGWWLGVGWLSAGLVHTYPELSVPVLGCAFVIAAIATLRRDSRERFNWRGAVFGLALCVAVMPPVRDLLLLLETQARAASSAPGLRPGEGLFAGLATARHAVAGWWALGSEHGFEPLLGLRTALAAALTALGVVGGQALVRRGQAAWLTWLVFPLGVAVWLSAGQQYPYGAYKAVLMGWWFQVLLTITGAVTLIRARPVRTARVAIVLVVLALPLSAAARLLVAPMSRTFRMPRPSGMATFRQVHNVVSVTHGEPVVIALRDEEACEWAVYFLRDVPAKLFTRDRYMMPKSDAIERAMNVDVNQVRWLLTDAGRPPDGSSSWQLRWRGGPYALWEMPPGAGAIVGAAVLRGP